MTVVEEVARQIEFWFNLSLSDVICENEKYRARAVTKDNRLKEGECERMKDIILESDNDVFHVKSELCKDEHEYWVSFWFYIENIQLPSHPEQSRVTV